MILSRRPSRSELKHQALQKEIKGNWCETEAEEEEENYFFNSSIVKIAIMVIGFLAIIVMILGFCQPLTG